MADGLIYEDFYPLDNDRALVVGGGPDYMHHTKILQVRYSIVGDRVEITEISHPIITGEHLRLGNYYRGKLWWSDTGKIDGFPFAGFVPVDCFVEQPFASDWGLFYTVTKRDGSGCELWRNGYPFWCNGNGRNEYREVGRASVYRETLFCERLPIMEIGNPLKWEVWAVDISTALFPYVKITDGANPFGYNGRLFYQRWNVETARFETRVMPL